MHHEWGRSQVEFIVGQNRLVIHPAQKVAMFKRHMGSDKKFDLGGKSYSTVELSALLPRHLKEEAQALAFFRFDQLPI